MVMRKDKHKYTTIQISKEMNKHIRLFCEKHSVVAGPLTEKIWANYISASMSGSIFLQG
jgi:hypothetical protein